MLPIEHYLRTRFLDAPAFAERCGIETGELQRLIARGLAPAPAYAVDDQGSIHSFVFGAMPADGAPAGQWFNPHTTTWVQRARDALSASACDPDRAATTLQDRFRLNYRQALRDSHDSEGSIPGFASADGGFDEAAFQNQFPALWQHFLKGTFGLCVACPLDEAHIVAKEVAQARLAHITDNGQRQDYPAGEAAGLRRLIQRYLGLSMPFSPLEYPVSSRKRLADDVLPRLPD